MKTKSYLNILKKTKSRKQCLNRISTHNGPPYRKLLNKFTTNSNTITFKKYNQVKYVELYQKVKISPTIVKVGNQIHQSHASR